MNHEEAKAAVKAEPDNPDAWYRLGRSMAMAGEAEKARDCFDRAVALDLSEKLGGLPGNRSIPDVPDWL